MWFASRSFFKIASCFSANSNNKKRNKGQQTEERNRIELRRAAAMMRTIMVMIGLISLKAILIPTAKKDHEPMPLLWAIETLLVL